MSRCECVTGEIGVGHNVTGGCGGSRGGCIVVGGKTDARGGAYSGRCCLTNVQAISQCHQLRAEAFQALLQMDGFV